MSLIKYMMALNQARAYTDSQRIAHIEPSKTITSVKLVNGLWGGTAIELIVGKTYIVTVDGIKYERVCQGDEAYQLLGNASLMEGEDTGEPFVVATMYDDQDGWATWIVTNNGASTVTISTTETIHPLPDWAIPEIPAEKLPGVCLPVLDLSVETMMALGNDGELTLPDEEAAQFEVAYTAGLPLVLRTVVEGMLALSTIATFDGVEGYYIAKPSDTTTYAFTRGDGVWQAKIIS